MACYRRRPMLATEQLSVTRTLNCSSLLRTTAAVAVPAWLCCRPVIPEHGPPAPGRRSLRLSAASQTAPAPQHGRGNADKPPGPRRRRTVRWCCSGEWPDPMGAPRPLPSTAARRRPQTVRRRDILTMGREQTHHAPQGSPHRPPNQTLNRTGRFRGLTEFITPDRPAG